MESGHGFFLTSQAHALTPCLHPPPPPMFDDGSGLSSEFSSSSVETVNQLISASDISSTDIAWSCLPKTAPSVHPPA